MEYLFEKFESIHRSLHSIKDNLKGFQTPFDVDTKIIPVIASAIKSGFSLNLYVLVVGLNLISVINRKGLQGIAAAGIVGGIIFSGLMIARADDFETTREKAFQARVDALTNKKLKYFLHEKYFEPIQEMKRAF